MRADGSIRGRLMAAFGAFLMFGTLMFGTLAALETPAFAGSGGTGGQIFQCANGRPVDSSACGASNTNSWQTGDLNSSNSSYREGDSVPFQTTFANLTVGTTYFATIQWETTDAGLHAYDYLTTYNDTVPSADPCLNSGPAPAGCDTSSPKPPAPTSTVPIPLDPNISMTSGSQPSNQTFDCFGCSFTSGAQAPTGGTVSTVAGVGAYTLSGSYAGTSQTQITVSFTAGVTAPVLAWGGHIASDVNWGPNSGAASINGSPYHMWLNGVVDSTDTGISGGAQDRALQANAVLVPPTIVTTANVTGSVGIGSPVTDTATLSGPDGAVTGSVQFAECGPGTTAPICTSGNVTNVGTPVAITGNSTSDTATSPPFYPQLAGNYCFYATYIPDATASYTSGSETNQTTECFVVDQNSPSISTTLKDTTTGSTGAVNGQLTNVNIGANVTDTATLT
ncbi:MAG TPA: hypothetical protein VMU99_07920, partial [Acidimicrobiales bacterium]|nr:hypothetical protein [Acidimicrobiales bacterium]